MPLGSQNEELTFSIDKYNVGLKTLLQDGLSEYFSDFVYKFRMNVSNSGIAKIL